MSRLHLTGSRHGIGNCIRTHDVISPASLFVIDGANRGATQHTFDAMPPVILLSLPRHRAFDDSLEIYKNSSAPAIPTYHFLPPAHHYSIMSAMHMPYDSPPFVRAPRNGAYDMADALDLRQFSFPSRAYLPPYDLPRRQHQMGYHPGSFELQYPLDDSHMFSHPQMAHPIPRRPLSPRLYASESHTAAFGESPHQWGESTFPHSVSAPAFSEAFGDFGQPSMFVDPVKAEGKDEAQVVEAQGPPPSWSMSGSLDPATGIYQMAPEHPRVRTAQACEKCRGRKAKCSGEHPACQRCRLRGLKCEYAAERKMRGPNKVKKHRESKAHSRRTSVASTTSTTSMTSSASNGSSFSDGSPSLASTTFTMKLDINRDAPPSPPESAASDNDSDRADNRRQRPRRIDLAGTRLYEQMPSSHSAALGHEVVSPSAAAFRRQSLPSYLLEGYVRGVHGGVYEPPRGIEIVETTPRPRSNPSYPHDAFDPSLALFPTSHSENSSSGGSVPITPLGELAYPNDYSTGDYNFPAHTDEHRFAPQGDYSHQPRGSGFVEPRQSVSPQVDFGAFTYLGDADATPTLDRGGKGFSAFPQDA